MKTRMSKRFGVIVLAVSFVAGCAKVTVTRINDTNRNTQRGFRYYMPRPYLVVNERFPVAGGDYVVAGELDSQGRVVTIKKGNLPEELSQFFALDQDGNARVNATDIATESAVTNAAQMQSAGGNGTSAANAQAASKSTLTPVDPGIGEKALSKSTFSPSALAADVAAFDLAIVVAKDAGIAVLNAPVVGVVPADASGAFKPESFIALKDQKAGSTAYVAGTTDGLYSARGQRSELGKETYFVAALKFKGKILAAETEEKEYVAYRTGGGLIVFKKPESTEPAAGTETSKETKMDQPMSKLGLTVSGDPRTDPLSDVNKYFKVLLLPDADEQYAVEVDGGLGQSQATMGFENGWMVEHAAINIDNTQMGKFVFSNLQKVADLGLSIAGFGGLPPTSLMTSLAQTWTGAKATMQSTVPGSEAKPVPVILQVRYAIIANPGVYPILKGKEREAAATKANSYVFSPAPPFTVVAYNVSRTLQISLVGTLPALEPAKNESPGKVLNDADAETLKRVLSDKQINGAPALDFIDVKKSSFRMEADNLELVLAVRADKFESWPKDQWMTQLKVDEWLGTIKIENKTPGNIKYEKAQ